MNPKSVAPHRPLRTPLTDTVGVAISTTGDAHRMKFLETCVTAWWEHSPWGTPIVVTVDGDEAAAQRAFQAAGAKAYVRRVGQPDLIQRTRALSKVREGRMGVATNKNTGIEFLMDYTGDHAFPPVEHLFLSDDDCWPKSPDALTLHMQMGAPHSMVCWGASRLSPGLTQTCHAAWKWPRGVMLYAERSVIEAIGGMDERFGPGGHEHVEWSQRIYNAGHTPAPFCTPYQYAAIARGYTQRATGAAAYWNCEDMIRPGETIDAHRRRKHEQTSIRRTGADWAHINAVMEERQGTSGFVSYRAADNGRTPATMIGNHTSRGAGSE